jgi:hypothetical protein
VLRVRSAGPHRDSLTSESPSRDYGEIVRQGADNVWDELEYSDIEPQAPAARSWKVVPAFAAALCSIGSALARRSKHGTVVVVSAPIRNIVGSLLALGYVVERLQARSFEDRFAAGDLVLTIKPGKDGRIAHLAEFRGYLSPTEGIGGRGVLMRVSRGDGDVKWWRRGGAKLVRYLGRKSLPSKGETRIPLPSSSLLTALVGPDEDSWISGRVLIGFVGQFPTLDHELQAPVFRYAGCEGALGEVLLLDANVKVASANSASAMDELLEHQPEAIIHHNASAFEKWRHRFPKAHHVVVLDRSSPGWEDEIAIVRAVAATRSTASDNDRWPSVSDTGLDMVTFVP